MMMTYSNAVNARNSSHPYPCSWTTNENIAPLRIQSHALYLFLWYQVTIVRSPRHWLSLDSAGMFHLGRCQHLPLHRFVCFFVYKFVSLFQGCLGNTSSGNTIREIRDRPVNTGKYKKPLLNGYFLPIKRVMKLKYQSLTHTPKNRV